MTQQFIQASHTPALIAVETPRIAARMHIVWVYMKRYSHDWEMSCFTSAAIYGSERVREYADKIIRGDETNVHARTIIGILNGDILADELGIFIPNC